MTDAMALLAPLPVLAVLGLVGLALKAGRPTVSSGLIASVGGQRGWADWSNPDSVVDYLVDYWRILAGERAFDETRVRELVRRADPWRRLRTVFGPLDDGSARRRAPFRR